MVLYCFGCGKELEPVEESKDNTHWAKWRCPESGLIFQVESGKPTRPSLYEGVKIMTIVDGSDGVTNGILAHEQKLGRKIKVRRK